MTLIVLALLVFSCWYVPGRLARWLKLKKGVWLWRAGAFATLAGYVAILFSGWYTAPNFVAGAFYNYLGLLFLLHTYLFFLTILADLARLALRRQMVGKRVAAGLIIFAVILVIIANLKARQLTVTETTIAVAGLEKPVAILHAPDLHLGAQRGGAWLEKTIQAINELNPDIIVYNGDLADSNVALTERVFSRFEKAKADQYMTTGNHEYYIDTEKILSLAAAAKVRPLQNAVVKTHGLQLVGLEYMNADRETFDAHQVNDLTIEEELPKLEFDPDAPIVVLHHSPVGLQYIEKAGADVMLSGHTHGGQVFPGTILIQMRFPYWKGLIKSGQTTLLVSQGAGTFGPYARLGSFNEIQLVRLIPGSDN